jgi:molybdopterin-synthase adenylyltransferase
MWDTEALDEVLGAVEGLGLFRSPRRVDGTAFGGAAALEGEIVVHGRDITLQLVLDASFPLTLPRFFLRPWGALGFIPHVDPRGFVCFADPEGLVLDRRQPLQIIEESFHRAVEVLADGASGTNLADFTDEFEVYWGLLPDGLSVVCLLDPPEEPCRIVIATDHAEPAKPLYAARTMDDISAFDNGAATSGKVTVHNALYLPLEAGAVIIPPHPDGPFWTADTARQTLLPAISETNRRRLQKLLKDRTRIREFVVVKLPGRSGRTTLFGVRYDDVYGEHPLTEGGAASRLVPLQLQRRDKSYLVRRGGAAVELGQKRVLLAGCGAVGGHLAFELARAGVLALTLVDHDVLTADNSFRHVLGRRYWGVKKAEALKVELETELPYIQVRPIVSHVEELLGDNSFDLSAYDLVVLALGNPTVELAVNERLYKLQGGPAAVFTWLEPLGIGGHALLTRNTKSSGCFECLYTPPDDTGEALANRAAFAAPGQSFGCALSGCGSLYTPYGSVDAVQTANLAARLAVDALTGAEAGNPLISWRGNAELFRTAGYHLSPRFDMSDGELSHHRYAYVSPQCKVCAGAHGEKVKP